MKTILLPCRPGFGCYVVMLILSIDEEGFDAFWGWPGGAVTDMPLGEA